MTDRIEQLEAAIKNLEDFAEQTVEQFTHLRAHVEAIERFVAKHLCDCPACRAARRQDEVTVH